MVRRRKAANKLSVNMKGVEARVTVPEGDYPVKSIEVSLEDGQKAQYLKWTLEITSGKYEGKKLYVNTSLAPDALWNLANLLTAAGVDVPDGELDMELSELTDLEFMAVVEHEDYDGRTQARVRDYYPVDGEAESDEDEDDKPAKGKKSKAKDEDDDEEDDEDEKPAPKKSRGKKAPEPEDDEDEEEEDEKPAPKSSKSKAKPADDEDEDEEEEVKKPARGKGKKKAAPSEDEIREMDEDELAEVIEAHDLDVDLDEYRTLRKKAQAVIDALEA